MTQREEWIEWKWTPEKPYPETLETRVYTRRGNVVESQDTEPETVKWWHGHEDSGASSNWSEDCKFCYRITHYRLASEEN